MRAPLISLLAGVRLYAPLIVMLSLTVLVLRTPGGGVGFVAGLVASLALAAHMLVFGAAEARRAFPPRLARVLAALAMMALLAGAGFSGLTLAPQIGEAALFVLTVSAAHLIFTVLVARAPTLHEGDVP
jgi:multisubunit Na+/H+ antiporter MnhB subunit